MSARGRLLSLGAIAAVAAVVATTAARGGDGGRVQVAQAGGAYPERVLLLTLPRPMQLHAGDVGVLENGRPVAGAALVTGPGASSRGLGVVLVVDASESMSGAPAVDAMAAARAFAARRAPGQELGLVTFNVRALTALRPTTDPGAVRDALASPPRLAKGTRLRDAADRAVALLRESRLEAGSVVLLSDGADTGSAASTADVVAHARRAHVRLYAVGLRSPQFAPQQLRALADGTGGLYTEATSSAELAPIYAALGERLAGEYLVRYRSTAPPGRRVEVTVAVRPLGADGTATLVLPGDGVVHRSAWAGFLLSPGSVAAVALAAALLAALAATLLLRSVRRPLSRRLADFVPTGAAPVPGRGAPHRLVDLLDRSLGRFRGWAGFAEEAEIARLPVGPSALAAGAASAALVLGPLAALAAGRPLLLLLTPLPPLAARLWVKQRLRAVRRAFEEQLPDMLQVLASALRAGHGLSSALGVVAADVPEPTRGELERARADERLGLPLEDALTAVARRMASGDLEQVALVSALHRETGGNTAEVLDRVHDAVRERFELRRLIRTLTAQGRMARWILTLLPVVVGVVATALNPGYTKPLWSTAGGLAVLGIALAMLVAGSFAIKRIVEIEG